MLPLICLGRARALSAAILPSRASERNRGGSHNLSSREHPGYSRDVHPLAEGVRGMLGRPADFPTNGGLGEASSVSMPCSFRSVREMAEAERRPGLERVPHLLLDESHTGSESRLSCVGGFTQSVRCCKQLKSMRKAVIMGLTTNGLPAMAAFGNRTIAVVTTPEGDLIWTSWELSSAGTWARVSINPRDAQREPRSAKATSQAHFVAPRSSETHAFVVA